MFLTQGSAGAALVLPRLLHPGTPALFGGQVHSHIDQGVQQCPVQLTQRARDAMAAGALEHRIVCLYPVEVAQGDFAVHDAARHLAVKVQRIRDIRDSVRFFVGVGDQQGVLVQLALCKAQLRKNAAVVQLVPHHHVGQKGAVLQRLLRGQHLPPHMQILLPDGGQGFVHLPVIAHGHLCTGLLRRMVKLCAEVRRDGVV